MKSTSIYCALTIALFGSSYALAASAQSPSVRVSTPIASYERGSHRESIGIAVPPVLRHEVESTYANGRRAFDRQYDSTLNRLRSNQPVVNSNHNVRDTTTTTGVGLTISGYGVERLTRSQVQRSAQEDALHMWQRTQHLRDLQHSSEQRRASGPTKEK